MSDRTILIDGPNSLRGLRLSTSVQNNPSDLCWMNVRYRQDKESPGRVMTAAAVDFYCDGPVNWGVDVGQQWNWLNTMLDINRRSLFKQITDYIRDVDHMDVGEIYEIRVLVLMPEKYPTVLRVLSLRDDATWSDMKYPTHQIAQPGTP